MTILPSGRMDINAIFEELKAESGKNAKLEILTRERGNRTLRTVIEAALNPFKMYYIKKIPAYATEGGMFGDGVEKNKDLEWALIQLEQLSSRKVTGKAAQVFLTNLLEAVSSDDAKVLERVVLKDLDCGVATSPNKVWPKLIPEFPIMLAEPFDLKLIKKLHWPALAQLKSDGMRFNAVVKDGKVTIHSRKGQVLDLFGGLDATFLKLANDDNIVFDGELLVLDAKKKILPRKIGNGILNKAIKGTISEAEAKRVTFKLWDMMDYEPWQEGYFERPYDERFGALCSLLKTAGLKDHAIPSKLVKNLEEAQVVFEEYLAAGDEGIILKDRLAPWEDKRSKWQIKMKGEFEADLECYGWTEGTKKYKGKLGAVRLRTSDKKLNVDCGTGFSDKQRTELKKKHTVGRIISIKYNAKIQTEKGDWSLFLPVFVEIREDKDNADSFESLKG